ncbi:MAG: NACHT domain-containing protein, partial [Ignavibacteriae bacterium]|nr:NACHT domain-containing protein [Ignavibacteriota bacterium]
MSENQSILLEKGLDQVLKSIGLVKDEITFLIDNGYEDYLDVMNEKFSYSKTFLHRENNLKFKEIFFPISVINHKRRKINYSEILNFFNHKTKCTSIIGEAGSGKSMLAKHIFLNSLKKDFRIPILIELRNFNNEDISFNEKVHRILNNNNLAPNILIFNRLLKKGKFIFILDGFDEINTSVKSQLVNDIDSFIDKFNDNYFIITSRYNSGLNSIPRFENHYIKSLTKKQIDEYIDVQCYLLNDNELAIK